MKIGYIRTIDRGWVGFHIDCVSGDNRDKLAKIVQKSPSMPDGPKPLCAPSELSRQSINENPDCAICGICLIERKV